MALKKTLISLAKKQQAELQDTAGIRRELLSNLNIETPHIIVISGVRRGGKSTLLKQVMKLTDSNSYFIFEDPRLVDVEAKDIMTVVDTFDSEPYFFDEIQNVDRWETAIRTVHDGGKKVFLTGSNASLLSKELGTRLTGRQLTYELFPFSYTEYLEHQKKEPSSKTCKSFLETGGFPEYVAHRDPHILEQLFQDIITRDIIVRYNIKNTKSLQELAQWLITNTGKKYSYNKLTSTFTLQSVSTTKRFISYLEDSYLIFSLKKFSYSHQKQIRNPKKTYSIDTGLTTHQSTSLSPDLGRLLEQAVFLHLRRQGKDIYYYDEGAECDFVVKKGNKLVEGLQVCYTLHEENLERELQGVKAVQQEHDVEGKIITFDQEDVVEGIDVIPAWKFLNS